MMTLMPLDVIGDNKLRDINDTLATRGMAVMSMANIDSQGKQLRYLWAHFFAVRCGEGSGKTLCVIDNIATGIYFHHHPNGAFDPRL